MMRWLSLYSASRSSARAPAFSSTYAKPHVFSTQGRICVQASQPASLSSVHTCMIFVCHFPEHLALSLQQLFSAWYSSNTAALWHGKWDPPHCCAQPRAPWQTPRARPPPP